MGEATEKDPRKQPHKGNPSGDKPQGEAAERNPRGKDLEGRSPIEKLQKDIAESDRKRPHRRKP